MNWKVGESYISVGMEGKYVTFTIVDLSATKVYLDMKFSWEKENRLMEWTLEEFKNNTPNNTRKLTKLDKAMQ